jgi:D-alanyl-D-alanine carboxypeptidase/D-alanyl-D-alanine-endopeptidase (penicillin-binding protein 4)
MTSAPEGQPASPGLERRPGSTFVRSWGTISSEGFHAALAVEDPAQFAATAFQVALLHHGIRVSGEAASRHKVSIGTSDFATERTAPLPDPHTGPAKLAMVELATVAAPLDGRSVLASRISVPVVEDVTLTNKTSQNLHAELLLRLLGKVHGTDGSFAQGARVVRQFLVNAGIVDADFMLYDGSGISPDDRMTPRAFTQLLAYASRQPWGAGWRGTLPVAGVDGTLAHRFGNSPLRGRLWAKTGTLNQVQTLAGYLNGVSGKTISFAILVNGRLTGSDAEIKAIDRIAEAIAAAE